MTDLTVTSAFVTDSTLMTSFSSTLPLQHSYREVGILLLYLAVGVSVFSGIAYTAEYEEVNKQCMLSKLVDRSLEN